ncbi:glutathionylspermidine synthase family protein [Brevibacillus ginsengisoli]|uniref:glutathionylspermidine synthase family protein n=1 Tax=Brevibacillus ginsengisoli TaxID=363854 RepID=UPI003CE9AD3F
MEDPVFSGVKVEALPVSHEKAFSITRDWCDWDRMHGSEYLVPSVLVFSKERVKQIATLTEEAYQIFQKTLRYVQQEVPDPYLIHQLGIPESLVYASRSYVPFDAITRFDIAISDKRMVILEYNSDTPTGVVESAYVANSVIRRYTAYENPSAKLNDRIKKSIRNCIHYYHHQGFQGDILFSATKYSNEDIGTVRYAQAISQVESVYAHLEDLRLRAEGLYAGEKKSSIWYRLYPWEHLPHDVDQDGFPVGKALISLIEENKLATISPPQSIITQSKGLQAFIWEMARLRHRIYDDAERDLIQRFMLPSFFDSDHFRSQGIPYVSKPLFGREGGAVRLFGSNGQLEEQDEAEHYWDQPVIYQQRVDLPQVHIQTEEGPFSGFMLIGAFCVGGKFAGILPRVGGRITGNLAYYLPAAMN